MRGPKPTLEGAVGCPIVRFWTPRVFVKLAAYSRRVIEENLLQFVEGVYLPRLETALPLIAEALASNCRLEGVKVRQGVLHAGIKWYAQRLHLPILSGLLDALSTWSWPKFSPVGYLGPSSIIFHLLDSLEEQTDSGLSAWDLLGTEVFGSSPRTRWPCLRILRGSFRTVVRFGALGGDVLIIRFQSQIQTLDPPKGRFIS
ncbi:unnamed protein product [Prunus armeniaca]